MPLRAFGVVTTTLGISLLFACSSTDASSSIGGSSSSGSSSGGSSSGASSSSTSSSSGSTSSGSSGNTTSPIQSGCVIFPADNAWNTPVDTAAIDTDLSASVLPTLAPDAAMHPDWGALSDNYGIPINAGPASTPVPITWSTSYGSTESDPLPCSGGGGNFCYPIPLTANIEGGSGAKTGDDRHVLFLATDSAPDHCVLYELYNTQNQSGAGFTAGSGAIWHLDSDALRTEGYTSADAAGLPILPGLVRWEEIGRGEIPHAIRFTMSHSRNAYIHPATHSAGDADTSLPPMGMRVRLKASFDDSSFTGPSKIVSTAMKKYGLILADNGSDWFISGESNDAWAPEMDDLLSNLKTVHGSDFEIVKTGAVVVSQD